MPRPPHAGVRFPRERERRNFSALASPIESPEGGDQARMARTTVPETSVRR